MQSPPLTRSIGSAERSMRALLERKLQVAKLSFSEWTALAFASASPLSSDQVVQRQIGGHIVTDASEARRSIDALELSGLITIGQGDMLGHTEKGSSIFSTLSSEIEEMTCTLYGDLPTADLEAAHRTLLEIAKRASALLGR